MPASEFDPEGLADTRPELRDLLLLAKTGFVMADLRDDRDGEVVCCFSPDTVGRLIDEVEELWRQFIALNERYEAAVLADVPAPTVRGDDVGRSIRRRIHAGLRAKVGK